MFDKDTIDFAEYLESEAEKFIWIKRLIKMVCYFLWNIEKQITLLYLVD